MTLFDDQGDGLVVSVLVFNSDNPNSNSAKVYSLLHNISLRKTKINEKRPGMDYLSLMLYR